MDDFRLYRESEMLIEDCISVIRRMQTRINELEDEKRRLDEKIVVKNDMIAEMQDTWIEPPKE